ncbi:MAG TPA: condensation domain-containing protein, partial [Candidatus Nanopelagicales bacterium]|nr:condensation domain-containing protein [Candidatus Nanopelagicales bacterium]
DVTLRIGPPPPAGPTAAIAWHDASEGWTLARLRDWIQRSEPGRGLGLRGLANARLHEENALVAWLGGDDEDHHPPWQPPPADPGAWDPEALYALEDELGCRVRLSWAAGRADGSFDAIVTPGDGRAPDFPLEPAALPASWSDLSSDPLQGRRHRELAAELHDELREALPSHMVPSAIVVLPSLPVTLNGKVDLRALPPPEASREPPASAAEPRNDDERKLAEIWCSVLGLPRVGIHDNFFEVGGDSILSILIIARAEEAGLALRQGQLFEQQTIAELAATLADDTAAGSGRAAAEEQETVSGPLPLTPIQRWFFEQELPSPSHFNQAVMVETPPGLDPEILRRALAHLLAHHDALRMRFTRGEGAEPRSWTQENLAAAGDIALEIVDLTGLAPGEQRASLELTAARLQGSLDISAGPLTRAALFQLGDSQPGRLLWIIHHLVVDVVSWRVLLPDLGTAYQQLADGQAVKLPAKTTSFKRWAERLVEHARGEAFEQERATLVLAPPASLPVDRISGRNRKESRAEVRVQLSKDETRSLLKDALRPYKLGVQDVLLTALAQAVGRWSGSPDVWIDLEGHGREDLFEDVDLSRTVGWFTTMFPVRLSLPSAETTAHEPAGDPSAEALMAIKEQLRAVPRRGIGYGMLRYLHQGGDPLPWPRPEISFNYVGHVRSELDAPGGFRLAWESVGPTEAARGTRSHVLQVNGLVAGDQLELTLGFSRDLHDDATIERLAADLLAAIRRLVLHCLSPDAGAWTPSDFPFVKLAQKDLRALQGRLGEAGRSKIEAIYPLLPLQKGLLFHATYSGTEAVYRTQIALSLRGELNAAALRSAWQDVVRRHPLLRSCFSWEGLIDPVQIVWREAVLPFDEHDWRGDPSPEARLDRFGEELAARRLPLDAAPLMRLSLVRTADQRHELFLDSHHVLMDGWSLGVILRDVFDAYRAVIKDMPRAERPVGSYESYLRWLAKQDRERAGAFWRRALSGFEAPTPLFLDRSVPARERGHRVHTRRLDAGLTARLNAAAEAERVTPATLIEGAWALLLRRYSGHDDVLFGTVVSGRDANVSGIENMVGLFIHTLPMRARIDEDEDVWTWLRALQADQAEARAHQHLP